jgi:hypothetical protein
MKSKANTVSTPIVVNIDDGGPINSMHWDDPQNEHVIRVPNSFTRRFAEVCDEYGVKGKLSILPMPCGLGRLDRPGVAYLPEGDRREFLDIARRRLAPRLDITPELVTHHRAYDAKSGRLSHDLEDVWFHRAGCRVPERTAYLAFALRILKNAGLPAAGVTSPWNTGSCREREYAEAVGRAFWQVHRRKFSFYSLHSVHKGVEGRPTLVWRDKTLGLAVVHVPWTIGDFFWGLQTPRSKAGTREFLRAAADRLLTADGRRGRIRELADAVAPVVICTHWQSLFCDGRASGLLAFETVLRRLRSLGEGAVKWMKCSELARMAMD